MQRQHTVATWMGAVLGTVLALFLVQAHAYQQRAYTEEFHHSYALPANGRVDLRNINGSVHITGWDRNDVKVDAVKYAASKQRLDEAKIHVDAGSTSVEIRTEYPDHNLTFNDDDRDNPAGVDYTLTVPRSANLDEIKLINGELAISGVSGEVRASSVNGRVNATDLAGRVKLSTVNGRLAAQFASVPTASSMRLSSVNGGIELTLPPDARAEVEASTVSGGISNDFGLRNIKHRYVGHSLHGELGGGGTTIRLSNVNGRIEIRSSSGKGTASVRDLSNDRDDDRASNDNDDDNDN
jgi:DUF4097 and DUF4098 domain-containing protein YvlB